MQKLIKLAEELYIIVDDSEIKENNYFYDFVLKKLEKAKLHLGKHVTCNKITHSTKPLEIESVHKIKAIRSFIDIKQISISEIENLVYNYSVKELANIYSNKFGNINKHERIPSFIEGFRLGMDITKDSLVCNEKGSLDEFLLNSTKYSQEDRELIMDCICEWLESQKEWNVEVEDYFTDECERLEGVMEGENIKKEYKIKLI